jgi:hypothetical protein
MVLPQQFSGYSNVEKSTVAHKSKVFSFFLNKPTLVSCSHVGIIECYSPWYIWIVITDGLVGWDWDELMLTV